MALIVILNSVLSQNMSKFKIWIIWVEAWSGVVESSISSCRSEFSCVCQISGQDGGGVVECAHLCVMSRESYVSCPYLCDISKGSQDQASGGKFSHDKADKTEKQGKPFRYKHS